MRRRTQVGVCLLNADPQPVCIRGKTALLKETRRP